MSSISKNDAISIYNFLKDLSCCSRCILRYLGIHVADKENGFLNPEHYLAEWLNLEQSNESSSEETDNKKLKKNTCPACLDCFNPEVIEQFAENLGNRNLNDYDYTNFFLNVSFPKCLCPRMHGMYLHLKRNFPNVLFEKLYNGDSGGSLEQPHKIFRCIASNILSKAINKNFHPKSNLSLLLILGYENDNKEVERIGQTLKRKVSKKNRFQEISRNNIFELLKDINDEEFLKGFAVPPEIPEKGVYLENLEINADPVYLGGRYLKFKRNVGQTPWVIEGVSVSDYNIQDIIFDAVCNTLGCDRNEMTFTASGREDLDVRMLGTGRPFYIKIDNPKTRFCSEAQLDRIQKEIIESGLAAVIKLRSVYASDIGRIKFGEEQKRKTYRALCHTRAPDVKDVVEIINGQKGALKISQLTVLRVLHRRTLLAREKVIYDMKATAVPDSNDLFELEVTTQAGTYVKEFVHGDFERTCPSISSIVGYQTDIVALDCLDIDLVWPETAAITDDT